MSLRALLSSGSSTRALSFSHLAGTAAKRAEDDRDDKTVAETGTDCPDDKGKDGKKGKATGDKPADGEDDDGDEDEDEQQSRRADDGDDDDSDEEMRGKGKSADARRRERARCAAIVAAARDAGQAPLACHLAFSTTMTRSEAIAALKNAPVSAPEARTPDSRTGREALNPDVGQAPNPRGGRTAAAAWTAAIERANPKKR